jgi:hypothetical protein
LVHESFDRLKNKVVNGEIGSERLHQSLYRIAAAKDAFLSKIEPVSLEKVSSYFGL